MKPFRCMVGLHAGTVEPAHAVEQYDGPELSVSRCSRCGTVIE